MSRGEALEILLAVGSHGLLALPQQVLSVALCYLQRCWQSSGAFPAGAWCPVAATLACLLIACKSQDYARSAKRIAEAFLAASQQDGSLAACLEQDILQAECECLVVLAFDLEAQLPCDWLFSAAAGRLGVDAAIASQNSQLYAAFVGGQ